MCGRYSQTKPHEAVRQFFKTRGPLLNLAARYNIAPTQDAPVVRINADGDRELAMLRWGLIPAWSKEPKTSYSTINARAETVATKPTYRAAFKSRRCLVPADGFYEWQKIGSRKQPYRITMKGDGLFAFAGLWEHWEKGSDAIESFTIIVTEANELMKPIHDRMPVILDAADYDEWLDAKTGTDTAQTLLRPSPAEDMRAYPISTRVNSPRNDDPAVIEAVTGEDSPSASRYDSNWG